MPTEYWFYLLGSLLALNLALVVWLLLRRTDVAAQLAQFRLEQVQQQGQLQQQLLEQLHQQRQQLHPFNLLVSTPHFHQRAHLLLLLPD